MNHEAPPFGLEINWDKTKCQRQLQIYLYQIFSKSVLQTTQSSLLKNSLTLEAILLALVEVNQKY